MDPITHTIVAFGAIFISYIIGYFAGKKRGAILGMAAVIEWVQSKVGKDIWEKWTKEDDKTPAENPNG